MHRSIAQPLVCGAKHHQRLARCQLHSTAPAGGLALRDPGASEAALCRRAYVWQAGQTEQHEAASISGWRGDLRRQRIANWTPTGSSGNGNMRESKQRPSLGRPN
jgi:hypothetical protein